MVNVLRRVFVKEGRLHPVWRVVLYLPAYLAVTFPVQVFVVVAYMVLIQALGQPLSLASLTGMSSPALMLALELVSLPVVLLLTWLFRRFLDGRSFASLGFRLRGPWPADVGLGLALGLVLMAGIFAAEVGAGWLRVDGFAWAVWGLTAVVLSMLAYLVIYIIVGLTEELIFRGYVFVNLRDGSNVLIAVVVSSAIFGLAHGLNPNFGPIALVNIALVGVFFCYAYLVTDNLWLPIAFHFSWNFCQGTVFSFPVSGTGGAGLFVTALTGGPDWVTGGAFGPEAGLLGTVAILMSFLAVWCWARVRPRPAGE